MMRRLSIAAALLAAGSTGALAQTQTVAQLLKEGFAVAAVVPSSAGPGLFLLKGDKLMFCVVAETPSSPDLATRYCKPVN
jgi:hypothetical protein